MKTNFALPAISILFLFATACDAGKSGTNTPGTNTPGTNTPGTNTPGTNTPGTNTPGTNTPGTNTPGTNTPDSGTSTPTYSTPSSVPLLCGDAATAQAGSYLIENNAWGKGSLTGYSQCVGIGDNGSGGIVARWSWNWLNSGSAVKAYPEIIYGKKPAYPSTTAGLPRQVNAIQAATVSFDYASTHSGSGNTAFDLWLASTANASGFMDPSLKEVMVWLDWYGEMQPAGSLVASAVIDNRGYDVFAGMVSGRPYFVFRISSPLTGSGSLNIVSFLRYLKNNGNISGDEFLQSIEFGNEVSNGNGNTSINSYSVVIQ